MVKRKVKEEREKDLSVSPSTLLAPGAKEENLHEQCRFDAAMDLDIIWSKYQRRLETFLFMPTCISIFWAKGTLYRDNKAILVLSY